MTSPSHISPTQTLLSAVLTACYAVVFVFQLPWWPSWTFWLIGVGFGWLGWWVDTHYSRQLYQDRPITMSLVFWLVAFPLAFFVVTSTPYWFGKGVVLGWLTAVLCAVMPLATQPQQFQNAYLYQLKRPLGVVELRWLVGLMVGVWLFLSIGSWWW